MSLKIKRPLGHFLSLPEVQSVLGIKSRKTILKYIKSGKLPAYKLGGTRWRITPSDIEIFLKKHQVQAEQSEKGAVA